MKDERDKNSWTYIVVVILVSLLIGVVWSYYHAADDRNLDFYFNVIGTLASIDGIILTFVEVSKMGSIASATKTAVDENNQKINSMMSASKVVDAERQGQNLKAYLRTEQYEIISIKMEEFIKTLIMVKSLLPEDDQHKDYLDQLKRQIPAISNTNDNVTRRSVHPDSDFDKVKAMADIDGVLRTLAEINAIISKA